MHGIDCGRLAALTARDGRPLTLQLGLAGIPRTTFYHIMGRDGKATVETLCKLAEFYGVSTDYLLGREPWQTARSR